MTDVLRLTLHKHPHGLLGKAVRQHPGMAAALPILGLILAAGAVQCLAKPGSTTPPAQPPAVPPLLADGGRTAYTIQVHHSASLPERHAAEELARFLHEISGANFRVQQIEDPSTAPGPALRIGPAAADGIISPAEIARLGPEGYILRTKGTNLAIAGGRPRGTLYGVYSFLEDSLSCRWFTPAVSRIPRKTRLAIRPLNQTFVPPLEYRATDYPDTHPGDWAVRNKINGAQADLDARRGGKIVYGPFVHTFDAILNPKDHFAKHPEYFSEVNGKRLDGRTQLCLSNPEVLRLATATVRRWMREQPGAGIFSVSQNDWFNYCTCPACTRIAAEEGSPSGPYLRFVNAIADAVRAEFPDRAVDTLAYQFTRRPPKRTVPRPNVIVRLCDIECCFSHPLRSQADLDPANAAFARDLRRWGEIAGRLYIWDYVTDFRHAFLPFPNLYVIRPNIAFFVAHGVTGVYEEGNYFSRGGEWAELRSWILAKTLWDPGYDTDRAIDEFLEAYYEEAAGPLRRYIDLIHGKARMDGIHFRIAESPASPLFSDPVVSRAMALFDEAEKRVAGKPAVLHRVQVARLPILYVQIARLSDRLKTPPAAGAEDVRRLRSLFARFDAVARNEGVTQVAESRSYDSWAAQVKAILTAASR